MQRTYYVTGSQLKSFRLKKGAYRFLKMKNILLTSLLITTSHAYSRDLDCDIIELDDFQEAQPSCDLQNNETENIEDVLIKHWKKSYIKQENQFIDNQYN